MTTDINGGCILGFEGTSAAAPLAAGCAALALEAKWVYLYNYQHQVFHGKMDLRFLRFESFEMFDTKTKRLFFKSVLAPTDFHPPFSSVIYMYILELLNSSRYAFHLHIM